MVGYTYTSKVAQWFFLSKIHCSCLNLCILPCIISFSCFPVLKAGHPGVPCYIYLFVWAMVGWVTLPFFSLFS